MQGYGLTFKPKIVEESFTNFWTQNLPIFVPVNFGQKWKAIALLFSQKLFSNFLVIFRPKIGQFLSRSILGKNARL